MDIDANIEKELAAIPSQLPAAESYEDRMEILNMMTSMLGIKDVITSTDFPTFDATFGILIDEFRACEFSEIIVGKMELAREDVRTRKCVLPGDLKYLNMQFAILNLHREGNLE